jgi:hypothetical protein
MKARWVRVHARLSVLVLIPTLLLACGDRDEEGGLMPPGNGGEIAPGSGGETPPGVDSRLPLPAIRAPTALCEGPRSRPPPCDWIHSLDGLIWGVLTDVRIAASPGVMAYNDGPLVDECPGGMNAALDLEVEIHEVLAGEMVDEVSGRITVRVGSRHKGFWDPTPVSDMDRELLWLGDPARALFVGQEIGVPFRRVEEFGLLSLSGESLFAKEAQNDGDALVRSQPLRDDPFCVITSPPPEELEGRTLPDLRAYIASCGPEGPGAALIRQSAWGQAGGDPTYSVAASCF